MKPFLPPNTPEEICELAHLYATEGLGDQEEALTVWLAKTAPENRDLFRSEIDAVTTLTLAMVAGEAAPDLNLESIEEARPCPATRDFPAGFFYQAATAGAYRELPVKGARVKELSRCPEDGFTVMMLEMDPGCRFPSHSHRGSEQVYLLDGDLYSDGIELSPGDFLRAAAETHHGGLYSAEGCHALIITAQQNYPARAVHAYDFLVKSARRVKKKIFG